MDIEKLEQIIRKQQKGKEALPEFTVGEQLLDMARQQPEIAELLAQDLAVKEMGLSAAAAKIKEYADKNHKSERCFCVTPTVAEKILREFYHLPEADAATDSRPPAGSTAPIVDLADFL
jgi:hypothetical protein